MERFDSNLAMILSIFVATVITLHSFSVMQMF